MNQKVNSLLFLHLLMFTIHGFVQVYMPVYNLSPAQSFQESIMVLGVPVYSGSMNFSKVVKYLTLAKRQVMLSPLAQSHAHVFPG